MISVNIFSVRWFLIFNWTVTQCIHTQSWRTYTTLPVEKNTHISHKLISAWWSVTKRKEKKVFLETYSVSSIVCQTLREWETISFVSVYHKPDWINFMFRSLNAPKGIRLCFETYFICAISFVRVWTLECERMWWALCIMLLFQITFSCCSHLYRCPSKL